MGQVVRKTVRQAGRRAAPDAETRALAEDHDALCLWLRLLATTRLVEEHIRRQLLAHSGTTLPRFDLMAQLERHPQGLKMGELSQRMMVTGGNVTGIADLLEREGLVARSGDPEDRRARRVRLTPAGRRAFATMAAAHKRWITASFAALGARDRVDLARLLQRLKLHIRALEEGRV